MSTQAPISHHIIEQIKEAPDVLTAVGLIIETVARSSYRRGCSDQYCGVAGTSSQWSDYRDAAIEQLRGIFEGAEGPEKPHYLVTIRYGSAPPQTEMYRGDDPVAFFTALFAREIKGQRARGCGLALRLAEGIPSLVSCAEASELALQHWRSAGLPIIDEDQPEGGPA